MGIKKFFGRFANLVEKPVVLEGDILSSEPGIADLAINDSDWHRMKNAKDITPKPKKDVNVPR
ncbi:MAG: hypothetical protein COB76_06300 [Alphaproteobacteria bacterium]|nr:MAG: hypothetical protein COB76_06300 [Alphaproteobacteria bacterium]